MIYSTADSVTPATTRNVGERRMIDRPWFVLLLLFGVTAAPGLPILWHSRGFSAAAKVLVSVLVTVYTVALLGAFALLMQWCVARIMNAIG